MACVGCLEPHYVIKVEVLNCNTSRNKGACRVCLMLQSSGPIHDYSNSSLLCNDRITLELISSGFYVYVDGLHNICITHYLVNSIDYCSDFVGQVAQLV